MALCLIMPTQEALKGKYAGISPLDKDYCRVYPTMENFLTFKPSFLRKLEAGFQPAPRRNRPAN